MHMDKEEARRIFDGECGALAQMALVGDQGSVHELAEQRMRARGPEDLLANLATIVHANFSREELNLPADNLLPISTDVEGLRKFCAHLYGFGALRFWSPSPGQPMGAGMRASTD
jgi:hypothetical protein